MRRHILLISLLCFLSCGFIVAKTYIKRDLKSQVYITWHLGEDCDTNAPRILSFGLNQESTLCLRSGMPYKPLYLKLKPKTETGSLNCAYNGGNYGACSDPSFADHCTFKTALDKCIVKITGKRVVPKSENDQLIKQPVLQSAVFDQYAPAYNVASTTTGVINLSDYHGMAIAADGENDIINETATLTGATSNATVTVNFTIDKQIKNTDQLVVLKFADKTQCTIIPQKQPNGTYGGECSIPLMPNRFGTAVIAATAPGYTIEPAAARIGSYFTISSHEYVSNSKDTCYLNAKNISVTSQFPATGTDQDHYLVFKPDTDGHSCTAGSQYIGISYPIIDESTGYITFSSDQAFKPYIGRAQINANATSQQAVLNMSLIPVYNMTSGDNVTNYYLRLNALSQVDLIALMDKSANKFTDFYHSSTAIELRIITKKHVFFFAFDNCKR